MDDSDWIVSLRQQVENLARRNEEASKCTFVHNRTKEMQQRIVKLRELIPVNPTEAAKYYVECSFIMDDIGKIVRRTTRRERREQRHSEKGERRGRRVADSTTIGDCLSFDSEFEEGGEDRGSKETRETSKSKAGLWRIMCMNTGEEEAQKRGNGVRNLWNTQIEFFLSCLGFIVGVGNTVRFPAKVYQYGGGVFFIPYITCMICFGLPIVYMHLCIGQFSGLSASGAFFKMMPIASGLGWALVLLAVPVCIYYNIIVAWAIYYFWFSFRGFLKGVGLPWDRCEESWVTRYNCCDLHSLRECFNSTRGSSITAPEAYFHFEVLYRTGTGDFSLGPIQAHLVLALAVAWILVFMAVFKGIGSIGWTVSVTATVPYLLLTILFLRGTSLPGAEKGLSFLFTPKFEKLWSLPMWKSAAEQVFYELGIDAGPLIAMASFSRYRNNIYRDAVLLVVIDAMTSVLCGMVIFSFIGFLAHMSGSEVNDVLQHDPLYLSFTVYPGVTSFMHLGPLWAALFFAMLALSALDAEFAWLEMIASSMMHQFGSKNKRIENRLLAFMCVIFFVCGLPLCARGGIYIFHSIESLNANWNSFSLGLLQMLLVCFAYGVDNFISDISGMLRVSIPQDVSRLPMRQKLKYIFGPVGPYIKWTWSLFCPLILTALLVASAVSYERVSFEGRIMPWGYELIAWMAMVAPLLVIPVSAIRSIYTTRKAGKSLLSLFSTTHWSDRNRRDQEDTAPTNVPRPLPVTNGYSYIDPVSRGQSTKSRVLAEADYGRKTGRIADFLRQQALEETSTVSNDNNTYGEGTYGISTATTSVANSSKVGTDPTSTRSLATSRPLASSITLFGSPPVSVVNSAANSIDLRPRARTKNNSDQQIAQEEDEYGMHQFDSRDVTPSPPHSEPPVRMSDLEEAVAKAFGNKSISQERRYSEEEDDYAERLQNLPNRPPLERSGTNSSRASSTASSNSSGRPQRPTVIRRHTSSDSLSIAAQSTGSISITPLDQAHHRSMSSIAIFDNEHSHRKQPKLSQLKRPKPIDAPSSLGPSPATSHF